MGFWDEPQGAAVFKHAVLGEYAPVFASKCGRWSANNRVAILDGYAGRGWYEDGSPGSPAQFLDIAAKLGARRDVRCWFIEEDKATYQQLTAGLADRKVDEDRVKALHGPMASHLDSVLAQAKDMPMFAFVDPFGIGIPFEDLVGKLLGRARWASGRRVSGAPTEVLVNFTHAGIYRNAGMLSLATSDPAQLKAAVQKVEDLDTNLGGNWWHPIQRNCSGDALVDRIRTGYVQRVLDAAGGGWDCFDVPVSDSANGATIYHLLLFFQHPQGRWFFNDAVSLARQVFQTFCDPTSVLQPPLWEPELEWVAELRRNLVELLSGGHPVKVLDQMPEVYGRLLGVARGSHVRRAAKALIKDGVAVGRCVGDPHTLVLSPGAARMAPTGSG